MIKMIIANNVQGAIWLSEDQSGLICLLPSNNLLLSLLFSHSLVAKQQTKEGVLY